jgi:hypothetical protein
MQHYVQQKWIRLKKLDGKFNSADLDTKELNAVEIWKWLKMLNFEKRDGRHPLALATNLEGENADDKLESETFEETGRLPTVTLLQPRDPRDLQR